MSASNKSSSESNFFRSVTRFRSWEEEAFAVDAARPHGASIWPPRFYNCSFCGRQFKSAQALGGHMNVHRRDKARLKQSPIQNPNDSRTVACSKKISTKTIVCNPSVDDATSRELLAPSLSLDNITASAPFTLQSSDKAMVFSTIQDFQRKLFNSSSPISNFDSASNIRFSSVLDTKIEEECIKKQKYSRHQESDIVKSDDHLPAVSLNLVVGSGKEEIASCKRSRTDDVSLEATMEDSLDLELRLGDQPNVK